MKWEYLQLGQLYEVHNGLSKGGKYFGNGFPFLTFSAVFNNWFLPSELTDKVQSTAKEQLSYSIKRGDVFITRTSETMDELGMSSVALKDYPLATYNGFTKRLRPTSEDNVLPEFIGYYLRSPIFRGRFKAFSSMTTRASLKNDDLLSMEVPVPPISTQQRIAEILINYDNLIENSQRQIILLEEAAMRLYKEWFVNFRFPGFETARMNDGIPDGWEAIEVGSLITKVPRTKQVMRSDYKVKGKFPIVDQSKEFISGYTDDDDTLVDIGTPVIVFGDHTRILKIVMFPFAKGADGTQLIVSGNERMPQYLLYCSLINIDLSNYHYARHFKYLKATSILVPTQKLAEKFEKIIEPYFALVQCLRDKIIILQKARDILLPKLMSREIEV